MEKTILVTGGAGFIGSNFILQWFEQEGTPVVNLDKLTYAGNPRNLLRVSSDPRYRFAQGDVCDRERLRSLIEKHKPRAIVHFAAESHVDRSIRGPDDFIRTNVHGNILSAGRSAGILRRPHRTRAQVIPLASHLDRRSIWLARPRMILRFARPRRTRPTVHTPLPRRRRTTWCGPIITPTAFPLLTTNCSNNYGPYQFPEKLIPLVILNARAGKPLPVYGDGQNVRDWVFVEDHCDAVRTVLAKGRVGETYNIGGRERETKHLEIVETICAILDELCPDDPTSCRIES